MGDFAKWLAINESTASDAAAAMKGLSGGLSFAKYQRAAALFLADRRDEAEALLPGEFRDAIIGLFEKSFPQPNKALTTSKIMDDPGFENWVKTKLMPFISDLEKPPEPTKFSVSGYLKELGIKDDWASVRPSKDGKHIFLVNRINGQGESIPLDGGVDNAKLLIKKLFRKA